MKIDLTKGPIVKNLFLFALPFILGNLLQQFYNIADTLIVGRFLGENALAAVGSSYTLMIFLTSILIGLCMGSGAFFSIQYGKKDMERFKNGIFLSFVLILLIGILLTIFVCVGMDMILSFLQIPNELIELTQQYLYVVFIGILATVLYNYFAFLLRSIGNSLTPLLFLGISAILNIGFDLVFILYFHWGVKGAALATVLSQYVSGLGIMYYTWKKCKELRIQRHHMAWHKDTMHEILSLSLLTCIQQSIMNFGILMVQGLVNSFGTTVMAAFTSAVKIDSFAYMPLQDFGNAFSTFIAQNYGANQKERISKGIRSAFLSVLLFSFVISSLVFIFARELMMLFIDPTSTQTIQIGIEYLRIEGVFYFGIGILFLLYGYYRAIQLPLMSVILTILSLGTRVLLAYALSVHWSTFGIWISVPIGWMLADAVGISYYFMKKDQ